MIFNLHVDDQMHAYVEKLCKRRKTDFKHVILGAVKSLLEAEEREEDGFIKPDLPPDRDRVISFGLSRQQQYQIEGFGNRHQCSKTRVLYFAILKYGSTAPLLEAAPAPIPSNFLYRIRGEGGELLYVGFSSLKVDLRKLTVPWRGEARSVEHQEYPTRNAVAAAKKAAIRDEHPFYNSDRAEAAKKARETFLRDRSIPY